uniref:NS4 protein n=1 Tax=Kammavanpettai virus TaxID=2282480 RepID=A0A3G1RP53_9REOV|nr:NS4 protein [Kammavanpettai virus]
MDCHKEARLKVNMMLPFLRRQEMLGIAEMERIAQKIDVLIVIKKETIAMLRARERFRDMVEKAHEEEEDWPETVLDQLDENDQAIENAKAEIKYLHWSIQQQTIKLSKQARILKNISDQIEQIIILARQLHISF